MKNLLAFDLGASNGRAILGRLENGKITMEEMHRFENNCIELNGVYYWDLPYLVNQLKLGFLACKKKGIDKIDSFGIDTWGVDFGLLDKNGHLLGIPRAYRDMTEEDMKKTNAVLDFETIFSKTGIANMSFNTVHQLFKRKVTDDTALQNAETLLLMPDLLGYFLTGEKKSEYTEVTTTMLYSAEKKNWAYDIIEALGLPKNIFTEIDRPGTIRGKLKKEIADELGINEVPFAVVGSHDTASALAAIPGSGNFAFCSSGTWSLFGIETDKPFLTESARKSNFSNEGTIQGGFSPLSNIMGLWLIQECRREWQKQGSDLSWGDIVEEAKKCEPFQSVIDPDNSAFYVGGQMVEKIQAFCKKTNQKVPETVGEVALCIYQSLALKYRWALERLEEMKGEKIEQLNIVGGGTQNKLLNQLVSDSIDRPVITGPVEGAAIGNLLTQAMALGEVKDLGELREIVKNSEPTETYLPKHTDEWEKAYEVLLSVMG